MSRIGKQPIPVPDGVSVSVGKTGITVKGPEGTVVSPLPPAMKILTEDDGKVLRVERPTDSRQHRALHGLTRSLLASAVKGVKEPFRKILVIVGVGYNAKLEGKRLTLQIGFCHPVHFEIPEDLDVTTPTNQRIVIQGCDKQRVGQFAADIRKVRPPEPYKGKGIRYEDERVIRKAGKSFVSGEK
ncbi:MAG: 50S ribosomal protein L6 [Planctomycetota bacterium]|jgi:large subunit ribosomal protein L6